MEEEKNIKILDDHVQININPKIYNLKVINSSLYVFLDKAYIIIDGDPEKKIDIMIKPKNKDDLLNIGYEFFNELLNYNVYYNINKENKDIKNLIIQRALMTNDPRLAKNNIEQKNIDENLELDEETKKLLEELENEDDDLEIEDDDDIMVPWEEKYGKKQDKTE